MQDACQDSVLTHNQVSLTRCHRLAMLQRFATRLLNGQVRFISNTCLIQALQADLETMKLSALCRRAREIGVDENDLEDAMVRHALGVW